MALPSGRQLFVLPAGGEAERHVEDTIARPVDRQLSEAKLPPNVVTQARSESGDGEIYCWGAFPGEYNQRTWGYLQPGDHVLFRQKGRYSFVARVIGKIRSADFAQAVWGADE